MRSRLRVECRRLRPRCVVRVYERSSKKVGGQARVYGRRSSREWTVLDTSVRYRKSEGVYLPLAASNNVEREPGSSRAQRTENRTELTTATAGHRVRGNIR